VTSIFITDKNTCHFFLSFTSKLKKHTVFMPYRWVSRVRHGNCNY